MSRIDLSKYTAHNGHQQLINLCDPSVNLVAFVAIHNTNSGPAIGGTRMYNYSSNEEGITDALNLSRAMTYKCALSGVKNGGGKGVIIGDPKRDKTEDLIRAYARKIDELNGLFITGEDVGLSEEDVQMMFEESSYFVGKSGLAGDPSEFAALSTFYSLQVAAQKVLKKDSLKNLTISVKGVGKVGSALVELLIEDGANIIVADVDKMQTDKVKKISPSIKVVNTESIHGCEVDIFSPCALGDDVTKENISEIKSKIICGAANNQVHDIALQDELHKKGILYITDYVTNAGGLINVADELEPDGYSKDRVLIRIGIIKDTVERLISLSKEKNVAPSRIADQMAEDVFQD